MSSALPTFSLVVPTRARVVALEACLDAIRRLDYPSSRYDVIVVDDGAATASAVARRASGDRIRVVEQERSGPAAARNRGAAEAEAEYVAFVDDDCAPDSSWLGALATALAADEASVVGGRTVNALTGNAFATASQLVVDHLIGGGGGSSGSEVAFLPSSNLALSRELFLGLGGFDTSFPHAGGEDRDFCARAIARGHRLRLVEDAVVHHRHALGPVAFWRQHYRYGRGAYRFRAARHDAGRRLVPEPVSFYWRLIVSPAAHGATGARRVALSALLAAAQVATAAGVAREALARSALKS